MRQPGELIGTTALELLLEEIEGGDGTRRIVLEPEPELVVRESTAWV